MSDIKLERTPSIRLYICRLSWGLWLLMFPCFRLNNGGFPSILLSCCCTPELSILSAPRAADLADGHWVNLNKQRALRNTWKPKIHAFLKIIIFVWKKRVMCDISVRLTFILTWRNALLLFRICNLCYYGRVVHGNEMLRTFGYTVLFLGKHYQAHYSPPGCAQALERPLFATLKSHFCTSHTPVLTSETKYQREEEETGRNGHDGWSKMWGDSPMCRRQTKRQSRIEAVRVRCGCCRQHSPRLLLPLLYAPASIHTLQYQLRDTVTVFTQRWRPSSYRPCRLTTTATRLQHFYYPRQSMLKNPLSPSTTHRLLLSCHIPAAQGGERKTSDCMQTRDTFYDLLCNFLSYLCFITFAIYIYILNTN